MTSAINTNVSLTAIINVPTLFTTKNKSKGRNTLCFMTRVMPRRTISAPNGHEQGECVVRPLIKSVLIFWGGGVVTPGYSVAIALPLYEV